MFLAIVNQHFANANIDPLDIYRLLLPPLSWIPADEEGWEMAFPLEYLIAPTFPASTMVLHQLCQSCLLLAKEMDQVAAQLLCYGPYKKAVFGGQSDVLSQLYKYSCILPSWYSQGYSIGYAADQRSAIPTFESSNPKPGSCPSKWAHLWSNPNPGLCRCLNEYGAESETEKKA